MSKVDQEFSQEIKILIGQIVIERITENKIITTDFIISALYAVGENTDDQRVRMFCAEDINKIQYTMHQFY
ncbi:TPA: hypothetical protein SMH32_005289 [Klebsiella oxytoca]|nr:hypothetical protein [Klebsiella oxytoca]